jgi:hypothetical protein
VYVLPSNEKKYLNNFIVADIAVQPILGLHTSMTLEFIHQMQTIETDTKTAFIDRNLDIFEGMGKFPQQCRIILKENSIPITKPPQRVPLLLRDRSLQDMEQHRIITKCYQPSDWMHNMVTVEINKSLRVCLDKKHKHKYILRKCSDKYEVMSALTAYRNSKFLGLDNPPAQMNHDRATKIKIPVTTQNLLPIWEGGLEIRTQFLQNQVTSKRYYRRGARNKAHFEPDQHCLLKKDKQWIRALVTRNHEASRSYFVHTEDGEDVRRNSANLKCKY